jgi:general secretion pathway protein G
MNNKKGFTLIELLVVIAIIGLLSTLAVVALGSAREKSRDARRLSDVKQIQTALELFYTDNNVYPSSTAVNLGSAGAACLNASGFSPAGCADAYMGLVPEDPGNTGVYTYNAVNGGASYTITTELEGEVSGLSGNITATPSGLTASTTP